MRFSIPNLVFLGFCISECLAIPTTAALPVKIDLSRIKSMSIIPHKAVKASTKATIQHNPTASGKSTIKFPSCKR
jgi:hypothetical protein